MRALQHPATDAATQQLRRPGLHGGHSRGAPQTQEHRRFLHKDPPWQTTAWSFSPTSDAKSQTSSSNFRDTGPLP